jgi:serpin B
MSPNHALRLSAFLSMSIVSAVAAIHAAEEPKPVPKDKSQAAVKADADTSALVRGNTTFGLDLYAQLRHAPGNTFLSPFSLSTALAMTASGARGETARQMAEVLHFPFAMNRVEPAFASLIRSVRPEGGAGAGAAKAKPDYQLHTANALWGQKGYHFLPAFMETLRGPYGATFEEVDFQRALEESRRTINTWAEDRTQGKIQDLIPSGALDATTRLVLTNAIYFKGSWSSPFRPEQTQQEDFHPSAGRTSRVPMMHQTGSFPYFEDDSVQVLELPYAGGDLAMVVLLPRAVDGLDAFERSLSAESLAQRLIQLRARQVAVALPRFKLTSEFELARTLAALGMTLPFTGRADFTGINGGKEPLEISAVIHKAYIDVNEEGTEAAAATAVGIRATSAVIPQPPIPFRADHPFLFLLRDRRTGNLLFLGCLTQPGS